MVSFSSGRIVGKSSSVRKTIEKAGPEAVGNAASLGGLVGTMGNAALVTGDADAVGVVGAVGVVDAERGGAAGWQAASAPTRARPRRKLGAAWF